MESLVTRLGALTLGLLLVSVFLWGFWTLIFLVENVDKVKDGDIIALRNGRSEVVDEHIRLELDKFGKVSQEPVRSQNYEKLISEIFGN